MVGSVRLISSAGNLRIVRYVNVKAWSVHSHQYRGQCGKFKHNLLYKYQIGSIGTFRIVDSMLVV